MKKYHNKWVPLKELEYLYDNINVNSLVVKISTYKRDGIDSSEWYKPYKDQHNPSLVNMGYLLYIWERRQELHLKGQELYYKIMEDMTEASLNRIFSSYMGTSAQNAYAFFNNILFSNTYHVELQDMKISVVLIRFLNFCELYFCNECFDSVEEEFDYYEAKRILDERTTNTKKNN